MGGSSPELGREEMERLSSLIKELAENADAIEALIRTAKALKESGFLEAVKTLSEMSDELFSSITKPEMMKALGNAMMLVYMLSQMDHPLLFKAAQSVPACTRAALEEASKTEKGLSILELMSIMRSPEMAAALKALTASIGCLKKK